MQVGSMENFARQFAASAVTVVIILAGLVHFGILKMPAHRVAASTPKAQPGPAFASTARPIPSSRQAGLNPGAFGQAPEPGTFQSGPDSPAPTAAASPATEMTAAAPGTFQSGPDTQATPVPVFPASEMPAAAPGTFQSGPDTHATPPPGGASHG